jgi:iron(III) transport system permease protein
MDISFARAALRIKLPRLRFGLHPRYVLVGLLVVVLGWLTLVPVARLVGSSFTDLQTGELTLAHHARVYSSWSTYELMVNSAVFALGACAVSFVIGTSLAWIIERTDTPFRRFFFTVALVPIIVPGIVTTIAWLFLLGPQIGWINSLAKGAFGLSRPCSTSTRCPA